jgi:uncharacterized protein YecE (DUF72 family)
MHLHLGTMGWSYSFWKGKLYPEKLATNEFLAYYAKQFNTVEVDSTFYRIPRAQNVASWKAQTPKDFVFSLKFPKIITHVKMLKNCQEETNVFLERMELLKEKLGALLFQFPYAFGTEQVPLLRDFLQNLPTKYRCVVEIRNRKLLNDEFYSVLENNNAVLAWVDSPFMPQIEEVTSDFIYVRWEGDRRLVKGSLARIEVDRKGQIAAWGERLKPFLEEGNKVFGYFSKYYSGYPPVDAKELYNVIGKEM